MENWKITVDYDICPFRENDFGKKYCTNSNRNSSSATGWDTCCREVCPIIVIDHWEVWEDE